MCMTKVRSKHTEHIILILIVYIELLDSIFKKSEV